MLIILAWFTLILAALPAIMFVVNLWAYRPPPDPSKGPEPDLAVLIPARNEEGSIEAAMAAALASRGISLEVVVLDDHSHDATAAIVASLAAQEPRVRLIGGPPLPPGWCGKQHACAVLARSARAPLLVFLDADVQLTPDGLARLAAFLDASGADLVSGIPAQVTETLAEQLVIPLIHFILLGFLPIARSRRQSDARYAAGCGQLFLVRRSSYEAMGGHETIRRSLHDGIKLPRAFRVAGLRTDLCDATEVATCRMYRGAREVWNGLAKNAVEALAAPGLIVPATIVLLGGQVLPVGLLALGAFRKLPQSVLLLAVAATLLAYLPRLVGVRRFRQPVLGAVLHPVGVLVLLALQWTALACHLLGRPASWKGRPYPAGAATGLLPTRQSISPP